MNGTGKGWHVSHANGKGGDVVQMRGLVGQKGGTLRGRKKGGTSYTSYAGEAKGGDVKQIGDFS